MNPNFSLRYLPNYADDISMSRNVYDILMEAMMSKQVTVKLDDQLLDSLNRWMEINQETNRSQVLIKALKKYISTPQTLEPVVVEYATMSDLDKHLPSLMEEHKEAMDLLK